MIDRADGLDQVAQHLADRLRVRPRLFLTLLGTPDFRGSNLLHRFRDLLRALERTDARSELLDASHQKLWLNSSIAAVSDFCTSSDNCLVSAIPLAMSACFSCMKWMKLPLHSARRGVSMPARSPRVAANRSITWSSTDCGVNCGCFRISVIFSPRCNVACVDLSRSLESFENAANSRY